MKPIYLSIEGINSIKEKQVIDFEALSENNIFCVSGPTGSGKTTILDCIILSLYGGGERGNIVDYINLALDKAVIVFRFLLDGTLYEITRTLRRKSGDKAELVSLSDGKIIAEKPRDANEKIEQLIGLNRAEFTQVVILEQGRFSKFLSLGAADRKKTVAQLFALTKYDDLFSKFNARAKTYGERINERDNLLLRLADATDENLKVLSKEKDGKISELTSAKSLSEKLEKKVKDASANRQIAIAINKANERLVASESGLKACSDTQQSLDAEKATLAALKTACDTAKVNQEKASKMLAVIETIKKDLPRIESIKNDHINLQESYKQLRKKTEEDTNKIALVSNEKERYFKAVNSSILSIEKSNKITVNNDDILSFCQTLSNAEISFKNDMDALDKQQKKAEDFKRKITDNKATFAGLKAELTTSQKLSENLKSQLDAAKAADAAAAVRMTLNDGDNCPVCGGKFSKHLSGDVAAHNHDIAEKENQYNNAFNAWQNLNGNVIKQQENLSGLENGEKETEADIVELNHKIKADYLSKYNCALAADFLKFVAEVKTLKDSFENFKELENQEKDLNSDLKLDKQKTEEVLSQGKEKKKQLEDWNLKVASDVGGDWQAVEVDAKNMLESAKKAIDEYTEKEKGIQEKELDLKTKRAGFDADKKSAKLELESYKDFKFDEAAALKDETDLSVLNQKIIELNTDIALLAEREKLLIGGIAERKVIEKERRGLVKKFDNASLLAKMCKGNKFLEFIEEEYILEFTEIASEKLLELSGGQYSLCYFNKESDEQERDGFYVYDALSFGENVDNLRKVKTLSGGETFLTSVSLAIAISQLVAKNKSFDFFFLDEGFGTLDEKAIETAANALFTLSQDILVGVVSHRRELVEKIPYKLEVSHADSEQGSKIKLVTA